MTPQKHMIGFMNRLYRGNHVYLMGDNSGYHVVDHTGVTLIYGKAGKAGYEECRASAKVFAERVGVPVFDMTDMRDCSICRDVHGPEIQHACE